MPFPAADEALDRCVESLRGYNELIIVVNDGIGFGPAVNRGLRAAKGEWLCVIGNDTVLVDGSLTDLTHQEYVVAPQINGPDPQMKPRAFYCMPRWVYEEVGGYDERYTMGFWEDDDLIRRWDMVGIKYKVSPFCTVYHQGGGGLTMKQVGERKYFEENKKKFEEKWGL